MSFVNYQYSGETLLELSYQKSVQCSEQVSLGGFCDLNSQVRRCIYQEIDHRQSWSKNVRERDSFTLPQFEQTSHNQCLARPHFARHDNKPFAFCYGILDRCQSLVTLFRRAHEGGIWREFKRVA